MSARPDSQISGVLAELVGHQGVPCKHGDGVADGPAGRLGIGGVDVRRAVSRKWKWILRLSAEGGAATVTSSICALLNIRSTMDRPSDQERLNNARRPEPRWGLGGFRDLAGATLLGIGQCAGGIRLFGRVGSGQEGCSSSPWRRCSDVLRRMF